MKKLNIVIPMAGHGSRFAKVGYTLPKPLIDVAGKPMIERVIENMHPSVPHRFIFICLREHYETYALQDLFARATKGSDFEVVLLDDVTDGAARTVLTAKELINNDDDLLIANSDQFLTLDPNIFIAEARKDGVDGLIMTFEDSDPKWSFAKTDDAGNVVETAEKVPISNHATVGIYYFSRGSDYVAAAEKMIAKDQKHNGEYYVCPVYNELIADGACIKIHSIDAQNMHGLGTPEDLEIFLDKVTNGEISIS